MPGSTPKVIIDAMCEMWAAGKTDAEVRSILEERGHHFSKNAIIGHRQRRGIKANARKPPAPPPMVFKPRSTIHERATGAGGVDPRTFRVTPPIASVEDIPGEMRTFETIEETASLPSAWTLFDLRFDQCHWPVGRDGELTTYCGAKAEEGCDYCGPHYREGHRPLPKRERL